MPDETSLTIDVIADAMLAAHGLMRGGATAPSFPCDDPRAVLGAPRCDERVARQTQAQRLPSQPHTLCLSRARKRADPRFSLFFADTGELSGAFSLSRATRGALWRFSIHHAELIRFAWLFESDAARRHGVPSRRIRAIRARARSARPSVVSRHAAESSRSMSRTMASARTLRSATVS
jgi:hypothetical protein